jgi:hypothetical protein
MAELDIVQSTNSRAPLTDIEGRCRRIEIGEFAATLTKLFGQIQDFVTRPGTGRKNACARAKALPPREHEMIDLRQ